MNPYKNQIIGIGAAALLAIAPAIATGIDNRTRGVAQRLDADTMTISAKQLLDATPLADRLFLDAVCSQLRGDDSTALRLLDSCREVNPNAAEAYYRLAQQYFDTGNDSIATKYMERAARLQPANDTYQESVAATYIQQRDYDSAIKAYENLYSHHRERTDVLDILARLYGAKKDYTRMLSTIERIEKIDGESDELTFMKMNVYEMRHDTKNAYRMLKALNDAHPNEPNYKVMLGNWLMNHSRRDDAFKCFQGALADDPQNAFALNSMYDYYRAGGDNAAADELREKILFSSQTESKTKVTMLQQAIKESEKSGGDSVVVLNLFDRTMAASPKDADISNMKAMYMKLKGMPVDSVNAAFEHTLTFEPDNNLARIKLIQDKWEKKKWDEVIVLSTAGTQYNPEDMTFYYFLGLAYFQKDDDDHALDALKRGADEIDDHADSDMASDFYGAMGDILFKKKQQEEAFEAYDKSLKWKEDNIVVLNNYAYYLSELRRDLKRAEQMSFKTVQAEPTNATYLDTYAWILFLQKRYDEARAYIDCALQNDTDTVNGPSAVVIGHAGDIYCMCGDTDRAVELWQRALKAGGDKAVLTRKIKTKKLKIEEQ
ncbi:tetratricopeptide repeat protein [Prevotella sp.]|uniref:tetratricopeptide repeat protein n=1 Tax=Prevotella sp. TaxID=59823 RepID=UPI00307CAD0A